MIESSLCFAVLIKEALAGLTPQPRSCRLEHVERVARAHMFLFVSVECSGLGRESGTYPEETTEE